MDKKALIVENLPCHQEIIPSWVWALNSLGYHVDIVAKAPKHRQIIDVMKQLMQLASFAFVDEPRRDYDVVVNNSLYPNESVPGAHRKARNARKTLSVLHTLPLKPTDFKDIAALRRPDHCVLALGPHMQSMLEKPHYAIASVWAPPIFFGDLPLQPLHFRNRFMVQGTMERFRRNYGCLAMLLNKISTTHSFDIVIMGDGGPAIAQWLSTQTKDSKRLKALLNANYDQFITHIRQSGWVLPCIDETFDHGYFERKITSSVMMAIGNGTPLIIHERLAAIYGLIHGESCLCYRDDDTLASVFEEALTISDDQYAKFTNAIRNVRESWLNHLHKAFELALE